MKKLLTMTTAAASLAVLMAGPAVASPLNTSISLTVFNGPAAGSGSGSARQSEQALPSAALVLPNVGTVNYTGGINFTQNSGTATIGSFLATGGVTAPGTSGALTLSTGSFSDATLLKFTFTLPSATTGTITHDDGISIFAVGNTTTNLLPGFSAPTSLTGTSFGLPGGTYDLYYSEVNGLPAALTFDIVTQATVPEPVSMALLGAGLLSLGMARRRAGRA